MRLTKREQILLIGALFIAVVAIFYNYVYLPLNDDVKKLRTQSEESTVKLQDAKQKKVLADSLEDKIETLQIDMETNHKDLMEVWDDSELLMYLEELTEKLSTNNSVTFSGNVDLDSYSSGDIVMNIKSSSYSDLSKLLNKFENAKYFNTITALNLSRTKEEEQDIINADLIIRFYTKNNLDYQIDNYGFTKERYGKKNLFD